MTLMHTRLKLLPVSKRTGNLQLMQMVIPSYDIPEIIRIAIYVLLAVAGFIICIKLLKFLLGVILGFILTLVLAYFYFFQM